jgi:hypothetical protein
MPYRNPEDKRRWEREHRQQRNERRKEQRLGSQISVTIPNSEPDPTPADPNDAAIAITLGIIVLSVGLLLVVLTIWDALKGRITSQPTPDPQTPEGRLP